MGVMSSSYPEARDVQFAPRINKQLFRAIPRGNLTNFQGQPGALLPANMRLEISRPRFRQGTST